MIRVGLVLVAAMVALCLPVSGGGSGTAVSARSPAAASRSPSARQPLEQLAQLHEMEGLDQLTAPASPWRSTYPRFLKTLPGEESLGGMTASGRRSRPPLEPVREILLTFDDGPDLTSTPYVLDELDRRHLKAIFFVTGHHLVGKSAMALARRDLVRKIASRGHMVANHTLNHTNLCRDPESVPGEVDGNSEIIAGATGVRPLLFRSPYGASCRSLALALAERDLVQVGWNIDPQDWNAERTGTVFEYVVAKLKELPGRGILLLHDTHPAAVRALPRILNWIDDENRRAARGQARPIHIRDYTVFLPPRTMPPTGLEAPLNAIGRRITLALPLPPALIAAWGRI